MMHNVGQTGHFAFVRGSLLIVLLVLVPLVLSNSPVGAALGILVLAVIFFFPGYLLLTLLIRLPDGVRTVLSPVFGIVSITTAYDIFARASVGPYFPYLVVLLSAAGMVLVALQTRHAPTWSWWSLKGYESVTA